MLCYFHRTHVKTNPFEKCHFLQKYISYLSNLMLHSLCIPSSVVAVNRCTFPNLFFTSFLHISAFLHIGIDGWCIYDALYYRQKFSILFNGGLWDVKYEFLIYGKLCGRGAKTWIM